MERNKVYADGFTADYLQLSYGEPDLQVCDSLEHGVIILYNEIRRKANSEFDVLLDEQEIDGILRHLDTGLPDKLTKMAEEMAEGFVNDLISKLRERGIDLRYGRSIWTGEGSILLWEYIRRSEKVGNTVFLDSLNANAAEIQMKKDEGRFTLQFNMQDPKEASAAKELNRYRHKAPFVAQAVWHYMNCNCREELRQTVIDIVKEYLKENTLAVIPENMEPKKEIQKLDRETAASLKSSLSAFQRK